MNNGVHHRTARRRDGHISGQNIAIADVHIDFIKCPLAENHQIEKYLLGQTPLVYKRGKRAEIDFEDDNACCIIILVSGQVSIHDNGLVRVLRKKTIGFVFSESFTLESDDVFEVYVVTLPRQALEQRSRLYLQDNRLQDGIPNNTGIVIVDIKKIKVFSPDGVYELLSAARHFLKNEWRYANINAEEILVTYISMLFAFSSPASDLPSSARSLEKEDVIDQLCATIKANPQKNYTSKDLETLTGMSTRVLQYSFARRYGMTPLQWALQMKLENARNIILNNTGRISITRLAEELNFASSSRFTEYYRRAFAETPRQTLLQLRNRKNKTR